MKRRIQYYVPLCYLCLEYERKNLSFHAKMDVRCLCLVEERENRKGERHGLTTSMSGCFPPVQGCWLWPATWGASWHLGFVLRRQNFKLHHSYCLGSPAGVLRGLAPGRLRVPGKDVSPGPAGEGPVGPRVQLTPWQGAQRWL